LFDIGHMNGTFPLRSVKGISDSSALYDFGI